MTDGNEVEPLGVAVQRASDDDRETAVARIRAAAGSGLLDLDEVEVRLGQAYGAKTIGDLLPLVADLPTRKIPPTARQRSTRLPAFRDTLFRTSFTVYILTIGLLIGIWGLSGAGFFWPFFPAAGWGIGIGAHYVAADARQRKREAKLAQRDEARQIAAPDPQAMLEGRAPAAPAALASPSSGRSSDEVVRRFVVVMFVDVVGSTELNELLGDAGWAKVRESFRRLATECFEASGGWEVSNAGDGIFARFPHPVDAATAAVDLRDALADRFAETGLATRIRVGIHSGDALETDGGDDLIGTVINLAARVMGEADPDEIFVTEHVADHLDDRFVTDGRGLRELRGIARPRHLLALRRAD